MHTSSRGVLCSGSTRGVKRSFYKKSEIRDAARMVDLDIISSELEGSVAWGAACSRKSKVIPL